MRSVPPERITEMLSNPGDSPGRPTETDGHGPKSGNVERTNRNGGGSNVADESAKTRENTGICIRLPDFDPPDMDSPDHLRSDG